MQGEATDSGSSGEVRLLTSLLWVREDAVLHYDGISWSPMTSGTTSALYGVWGTSDSDVFVCGSSGTIRHYDGIDWSPMTSGTSFILWGFWGTSGTDIFLPGQSGTILHYGEDICDDGIDNDGDGNTDCDDFDCDNDPACAGQPRHICDDGIDNDGDGDTDCEDTDCDGLTCDDGDACTTSDTCAGWLMCRRYSHLTVMMIKSVPMTAVILFPAVSLPIIPLPVMTDFTVTELILATVVVV